MTQRDSKRLSGEAPRAIYHAHHQRLEQVERKLSQLRDSGFDAVQTGPLQRSKEGTAWFLRYQPWDHLEIDGLGSREDLERLCTAADQLGMRIIADVVFNHMAIPPGCHREAWIDALAKAELGRPAHLEEMMGKLDQFPHLDRGDFQPWRDMRGEDWDNENRYESWGNGEWPELKPNPKVLSLHAEHLRILVDSGVRGFRFDAVKHMRAKHIENYIDALKNLDDQLWCYGEVLSGNPADHEEYVHLHPTTDFCFIWKLKEALAPDEAQKQAIPGPLQIDPEKAFLSHDSIRFGINHDLVLNDPSDMAGLLFPHPQETILAKALTALMAAGTTLVFGDQFQSGSLEEACLIYRRDRGGLKGSLEIHPAEGSDKPTETGGANGIPERQRPIDHWIVKAADETLLLDCRPRPDGRPLKLAPLSVSEEG